jgi:hypothetical protein
MRGYLLAVVALAGLIAPAAALASDTGGVGVRLIQARAASGDPLATAYILDRLAPGTTIHRRIEVSNSTGAGADVAVYPAAAGLSGGSFSFAPGHSRNQLSDWTTIDRSSLHLPAGGAAVVMVTIKVPRRASSGERYAVVWAQVSTPAATGGVRLVNRVGIRIYLSIGPGGAPISDFSISAPTAKRSSGGRPLVAAEVRNIGRSTLDIGGYLMLAGGPGGLRAGPFPVTLGAALSPGGTGTATVLLDRRLPRGPWRAELHLRSGSIRHVAAGTIRFAAVPQPSAAAPAGHLLVVIAKALAVLAMIALAIVLLRRARSHGVASPPGFA